MSSTDPEAQTMLAAGASAEIEAETLEHAAETGLAAPGPRRRKRKRGFEPLARGSALGRYVILDQLGVGGMGVVYGAYDPELDRRVAIKLLQAEQDAPDDATAGHARLLREAQAMARLTHPNVIAVYDVGSFENSVFVAMEFVAGKTMTDHLDARWAPGNPDLRAIINDYIAAGRGLAAAHAAGVVHRDFKPDNVMVADDGRVLVLDFGLARPMGAGDDSDDALASGSGSQSSPSLTSGRVSNQLTRTGTVMGTPAYMSPEQMTGQPTDAPTDQFSFCVALYQGLYGERPFAGRSFADLTSNVLRGRVRDAPRGAKVPQWIRRAVLRGLSRSPEDRYASMNELLAALERDPARRRRNVVAGATAFSLLAGAAIAGARLTRAPDPCADAAAALEAVWSADQANAVQSAFDRVGKAYASDTFAKLAPVLQRYADDWASARTDACEAARVRGEQSDEVMELRMACLDRRLRRLSTLVEFFREADAATATEAMNSAHALPALASCADVEALRSDVPPPDDPDTRAVVEQLRLELQRAAGLAAVGRFTDAKVVADALVERGEATGYEPIVAELLAANADLRANLSDGTAAREMAMRSLLLAEAWGIDRLIVANLLTLADVEGRSLNDFQSAKERTDRAAAVIERMGNPVHERMRLHTVAGAAARVTSDWDSATDHYERALQLREEMGLANDSQALSVLNALGMTYIRTDKLDKATELAQRSVAIGRETLGPSHPNVGVTLAMLGRLSAAQEKNEESVSFYLQAREIFVASLGETHSNVPAMDNALGLSYASLDRLEEARAAYESGLRLTVLARGADHLDTAAVHANLGNLLRRLKRADEAVEHHQAAMAIKRKRLGDDHFEIAYTFDNLGDDHRIGEDYEAARRAYERSIALLERLEGPESSRLPYPLSGLGMVHLAQGNAALARPILERAVALDVLAKADAEESARAAFPLAQALWQLGERPRALSLAKAAEAGWAVAEGSNGIQLQQVRAWLAER